MKFHELNFILSKYKYRKDSSRECDQWGLSERELPGGCCNGPGRGDGLDLGDIREDREGSCSKMHLALQ